LHDVAEGQVAVLGQEPVDAIAAAPIASIAFNLEATD
jgi:hypothetical protein